MNATQTATAEWTAFFFAGGPEPSEPPAPPILTATYRKGMSGRTYGPYGPGWSVTCPTCIGPNGGSYTARYQFRSYRQKGTFTCEGCGTVYQWRAPR